MPVVVEKTLSRFYTAEQIAERNRDMHTYSKRPDRDLLGHRQAQRPFIFRGWISSGALQRQRALPPREVEFITFVVAPGNCSRVKIAKTSTATY